MAGKPAILKIDVLADAGKATQGLNDAGKSVDQLGKHVDTTGRKLNDVNKEARDVGETFGETASRSAQVAGAMGDLGGALQQAGGPLGAVGTGMQLLAPSIMGLTGVADLAEVATTKLSISNLKSAGSAAVSTTATIAQTVATKAAEIATRGFAVAQSLLDAAMDANPIFLIIGALVLLGAAFAIAWNKSATFRAIVLGTWSAISGAVRVGAAAVIGAIHGMINFFGTVGGAITRNLGNVAKAIFWPFFTGYQLVTGKFNQFPASIFVGAARAITGALSGVTNAITAPFIAAWNWIDQHVVTPLKDTWNSIAGTINAVGFSVSIPSWVPGFGGKTWTFPPAGFHVPELARGAVIGRPTLALVGEGRGREIVTPERLLRQIVGENTGQIRQYSITVNAGPGSNPAETGRAVVDAIRAFERAAGAGWRTA